MRAQLVPLACLGLLSILALGAGSAPAAAPATPLRATMLGDSVAAVLNEVPQARDLLGEGLDVRYDLRVCRRLVSDSCPYRGVRPPSALDVVKASSRAELGDVVVVDVGYNDPVGDYRTNMDILMGALAEKGVPQVIWVTLREQRSDYRTVNQAIRAAAARWPQIRVADWDEASRGQDWFNPDGLHLNGRGAMGLAKLLRPHVLTACGAACAVQSIARPAIRGTPRVGLRLTCLPGSWTGLRPIRLAYRWYRNGRVVPGAAAARYRLRAVDKRTHVACQVEARNAVGSERAISKALAVGLT